MLAAPEALDLLRQGDLDIEGRLVDASNTTLRAVITWGDVTARCVYKPVRGERPLWDFPDGTLAGREVAAYLVGEATGWAPVPPTVLRDGPFGPGACQLWIDEADPEADDAPEPLLGFVPARRVPQGWHRIARAEDERGRPYVLAHADDVRLQRLAAFDVVINNADRKGGHVLQAGDHVYGVDHGVCFHTDTKLRTVLWGFVGTPLAAETAEVLHALRDDLAGGPLGAELAEHISQDEIAAAVRRTERLLAAGCYPTPSDDWPAVPWPPM